MKKTKKVKKVTKKVKRAVASSGAPTMRNLKTGFAPLGDKVLVRVSPKEERTVSGIIIPETVSGERSENRRGKVVAVGAGKYEEGKLVPVKLSIGDEVLFQWGDKLEIEGEDFYIVSESNVLGVFN
jgi:chaperonin GroES